MFKIHYNKHAIILIWDISQSILQIKYNFDFIHVEISYLTFKHQPEPTSY